ncbi:hypothetical protein RND81_10G195700 [Saponaria officinalis]|uniref:Ubiquitin thioesterase OTU n=1 Tax=Saponaria officinalis TaxID=3572 RepID=A0AAW1I4T3_SAPOF
MVARFSNDAILDQLRSGSAHFELVSSPVRSISESNSIVNVNTMQLFENRRSHWFFATIGSPFAAPSSVDKKVEHYSVRKVAGDGRCMFRALVKGMAVNKGINLTPLREREDADELRTAVKEVICEDKKEQRMYKDAVIAITVDEPLHRYCQRIGRSDFWGGESELLVLSKLCHQPIIVYIPQTELKGGGRGFIPIAEYGAEYYKPSGKTKPRKAVRLLYSGSNHYDLLV